MEEKYKELFDLTKDLLFNEQERFNRVDAKASSYMSALTLIVAAAGFFSKWTVDHLVPPGSPLEWLALLLATALTVLVVLAWLRVFRALKVATTLKIPLSQEMLNLYDENRLIDVHYALSKGNRDAFEKNVPVTNEKARQLAMAYRLMVAAVFVLVAFAAAYAVAEWKGSKPSVCTTEENNMTEQEKAPTPEAKPSAQANPSGQKPTSGEKPDPTVKTPQYQALTEGYDPKSDKTKVQLQDKKGDKSAKE